MTCTTTASLLADITRRSVQLADLYVVSDIETSALPVAGLTGRWYDLRPMLDERENCAAVIDMSKAAIDYAEQRGLIHRHPGDPHLVRVLHSLTT